MHDYKRWNINASKLDLKPDGLSCKKYSFRKAKLIICQMMCTKLLSINKWDLEKDVLVNIFNELKEKYLEEDQRFIWIDNMEEYAKLKEKFSKINSFTILTKDSI